jgi:hypothetical protein
MSACRQDFARCEKFHQLFEEVITVLRDLLQITGNGYHLFRTRVTGRYEVLHALEWTRKKRSRLMGSLSGFYKRGRAVEMVNEAFH